MIVVRVHVFLRGCASRQPKTYRKLGSVLLVLVCVATSVSEKRPNLVSMNGFLSVAQTNEDIEYFPSIFAQVFLEKMIMPEAPSMHEAFCIISVRLY